MLFKPVAVALLCLLQAGVTIASPTFDTLSAWQKSQPAHPPKHASPRPNVQCHPHAPKHTPPPSPPRNRICYVQSHGDGVTDDSPYILEAIHACNPGGHVVFMEGTQYIIGTALDLTFLKHMDLGMHLNPHSKPNTS
jgi:galacturan 1,4-alpha-galacturonidase